MLFFSLTLTSQAQLIPSPSDEPESQQILVESRWLEDGVTRLKLESAEGNSKLRKVDLHLGHEAEDWAFSLRSQSDLENGHSHVDLSCHRDVNSRLRTFLQWNHHNESSTLGGGLECSLFGPDRWRASHTVTLAEHDGSRAATETSLGLVLSETASVELSTVKSDFQAELKGGVSCRLREGVDIGATLTAQRSESIEEQGPLHWQRPSWEGHLRWSW